MAIAAKEKSGVRDMWKITNSFVVTIIPRKSNERTGRFRMTDEQQNKKTKTKQKQNKNKQKQNKKQN